MEPWSPGVHGAAIDQEEIRASRENELREYNASRKNPEHRARQCPRALGASLGVLLGAEIPLVFETFRASATLVMITVRRSVGRWAILCGGLERRRRSCGKAATVLGFALERMAR
jgi:hypothetical protein